MKNARWKKQRGTDLPCLWDGESVWCFLMGPAEGGKRTCKLSAYPPQVVHTPRAVVFDLYVEDEADAKAVLEVIASHCQDCSDAHVALGVMDGKGLIGNRSLIDEGRL